MPYFADSIWMNVQEQSDVLQVKKLHDTRTALLQHFIAFTGHSTMEIKIARTELAENALANHGMLFHRFHVLIEEQS